MNKEQQIAKLKKQLAALAADNKHLLEVNRLLTQTNDKWLVLWDKMEPTLANLMARLKK
jgi:hypothetical protein